MTPLSLRNGVIFPLPLAGWAGLALLGSITTTRALRRRDGAALTA